MYEEANRQSGVTGDNLLRMLESRLDNVVFRAGWGASRSQARQLVRHGHVRVAGRRVTIPSYRVRQSERVELSEKAREFIIVRHNLDTIDRRPPAWLEVEDNGSAVRVLSLPLREQIDTQVREQLIVELYSK
jgi:small subunit ribosomal protein S4